MSEFIKISHGSGGILTGELIRNVFTGKFGMSDPLTDSAIIELSGTRLAFTTDSYVIDPVFFPGGNIGKLSVCGTVNDLAVSGATPLYISASFIIEEGFPLNDLETIALSMAEEAAAADVRIVTGDTKVVEKGKCDKIFITTAGTGSLKPGREYIGTGKNVRPGDKLIVNGPLGNHAVALLGVRNNLNFTSPVISDCASLNKMIGDLVDECPGIHFMRDLTRGGLAGILNELSVITGFGITIDENNVPVDDPVRGLCEILGFDPFYLANEGKVLIVADADQAEKAIGILKRGPHGIYASIIGEIESGKQKSVVLNTVAGGKRVLPAPSGIMLPRIC